MVLPMAQNKRKKNKACKIVSYGKTRVVINAAL